MMKRKNQGGKMKYCRLINPRVYKIIISLSLLLNLGVFASQQEEQEVLKVNLQKTQEIFNTIEQGKDYELLGKKIIFEKDVKLSWGGKGVLVIKAENDIEFEEGSLIESLGKGGVILHPNSLGKKPDATVKFASQVPYIDFSKGSGAISLFYNPETGDKNHKYQNPTNWSPFIKTSENNYFKSFMFINNGNDLGDINLNLEGNYALSKNVPVSIDTTRLDQKFRGFFLHNGNSLTQSGWISFDKYPRPAHDVFLELFSNRWNHHILELSPPLLEEERNIFKLTEKGRQKQFEENFENYNSFPLINTKGETLLHVAIRTQYPEIIDFILGKFSNQNCYIKELLEREDFSGHTPLMVAAKYGNTDLFAHLYKIYRQHNLFPPLELLLELSEKRIKEVQKDPLEIFEFLKTCKEEPVLFNFYWQGFSDFKEAVQKEYFRQQKVTDRFFAIKFSTGKTKTVNFRTKKIFDNFIEEYNAKVKQGKPYNLNGVPSRSRIILMYNISEEKLKKDFAQTDYWTKETKSDQSENFSWEEITDRFSAQYSFGGETHTFTNKPTSKKPGFIYYHNLGTYQDSILPNLYKIFYKVSPSNLAGLFHESRISGNAITHLHLMKLGYKGSLSEAIEDTNFLNRLQLLLDLEVVSRLHENGNQKTDFDQLPIGLACARSFILCQEGKLSLVDILKYNSKNGNLFEGEIGARQHAIWEMNQAFNERFKGHSELRRISNIIDLDKMNEWEKIHQHGITIATREEMHQELLEEYGGGYESDGDGYETE
jgi:hypothetical protein